MTGTIESCSIRGAGGTAGKTACSVMMGFTYAYI